MVAVVPELVQCGDGHHEVRCALPWDCSVYITSELKPDGQVVLTGLRFTGGTLDHEVVRSVSVTRILGLLNVEAKRGLRQGDPR